MALICLKGIIRMIVDIINKKRLGEELSFVELRDFFEGYLDGKIADYQMSSLLMAIVINGMSLRETIDLTEIFIKSGEVYDLSKVGDVVVDKHSTGGVGDKTSLVVLPLVASCGVIIAKMSGRGLGHTGGTIDKLESIPGFKVNLTEDELALINQPYYVDTSRSNPKKPRYYQRIAINRVIEAVAQGKKRLLLVMATGTGKTFTAFQIVWRLWKARKKKKIL